MRLKIIDIAATSLRIRELIRTKGYTASDIQKLLGLRSVQSIYNWCSPKNKALPDIQHMLQLADILNLTIEELLITRDIDWMEEQQDL